ncbi:hypothetical protein CDAR_183511 [Caerostris darwini]|uniref:Uncharacterized protein n=1 Tax=Caerostris darwini TaxID=1538125 RepID=A0AAV4QX52_9ARAC|nr:hypothetical protein CDAR_183511 [Caerostris darwini]
MNQGSYPFYVLRGKIQLVHLHSTEFKMLFGFVLAALSAKREMFSNTLMERFETPKRRKLSLDRTFYQAIEKTLLKNQVDAELFVRTFNIENHQKPSMPFRILKSIALLQWEVGKKINS